MAFDVGPQEDETDRRIRAEIAELLAAPMKRTRRATPPEFRNSAGRLALSLWREQAVYSNATERYEKWRDLLDDAEIKKINTAITRFHSSNALVAAWIQQSRHGVIFEGDSLGAQLDRLRELIPEVGDEFLSVMSKPVAERTAYAEAFGRNMTRVLKEYLEVPSHRPKVKQSKADLGSLRARWDELRVRLPQVDLEMFLSIMSQPVKARTDYAEERGKDMTRVLKDYLEIPSHRPRVKRSEADIEDDKWMRRLAAYILNFPAKCR